MVGATALVALAGIILAIVMKPSRALGILILSALVWPEYLRVPMGLAQMSAPRLIGIAILLKTVFMARPKHFRWRNVDSIVLAIWAWDIVAALIAGLDKVNLVTVIGRGLDTAMMYFIARRAIGSVKDIGHMIFPVVIGCAVMAFFGMGEAITSESPYQKLFTHHKWIWFDKAAEYRLGFLRSRGAMSHPIYFGMAMFLLTGFLFATRHLARPKTLAIFGSLCAFGAALSSLSSGPMVALMLLILCNSYYWFPGLIKPSLIVLAVLCFLVELGSNRHFYELVDYLALNTGTAWYRTKLMEVAVAQLHEYWAFGCGSNWPHHWGALIDGRRHVDVVNHYINVALSGGLFGLALYITVHVLAIRNGVRAFQAASEKKVKAFLFGLTATIVALDLAANSVGLYSAALLFTFILLALLADPERLYPASAGDPRRRMPRRMRMVRQRALTPDRRRPLRPVRQRRPR